MARVVVTAAFTIPAGAGYPAMYVPGGATIEVTAAQASAMTSAGGTTRTVSTATMHDQMGESAAVSNGN